MARDLKRLKLGLFLTSNTPKMPKGGGRQIHLCSLHPCWTGLLLGSDFLCTVPLKPCKSHPIPAEVWECIGSLCSVDLQALQCIILQACWLLCLLAAFPYCLLHLIHYLPLPVLCLLPYFTDPKEENIFPFQLHSETSKHTRTRSLPFHHPGALCYGNICCDAQYITCK